MLSTYSISISVHADKTLHWKISGNINDTDTFPPYLFLKSILFRQEFMHEFMCEFVDEFVHECWNEFV